MESSRGKRRKPKMEEKTNIEDEMERFVKSLSEEQKNSLGGGTELLSLSQMGKNAFRSLITAGVTYGVYALFIQPYLESGEKLIEPEEWDTSTYYWITLGAILILCSVYYGWYCAFLRLWNAELEMYQEEDFYESIAKKSPEFKAEWEKAKSSKSASLSHQRIANGEASLFFILGICICLSSYPTVPKRLPGAFFSFQSKDIKPKKASPNLV